MKKTISLGDKLRTRLGKKEPRVWKVKPELLLCSQIPAPMHAVNPRTIMGVNWWNRERLKSYKSTDYHCQACGVFKYDAKYHQWLEAHEQYEIDYLLGRMTYIGCMPVCHYCHAYIHQGRLQALLDQGKIHHAKFVAIHQHGDEVLRKAGLERKPVYSGPTAEWQDWRLILDGKEYKPVYRNFDEWKKAMGVE